jgi:hypothetical protein
MRHADPTHSVPANKVRVIDEKSIGNPILGSAGNYIGTSAMSAVQHSMGIAPDCLAARSVCFLGSAKVGITAPFVHSEKNLGSGELEMLIFDPSKNFLTVM